jgi:primase-polymerase (primpol)-like protein
MTRRLQGYIADPELLARLPKALQKITTQRRWVVWRWEKRIRKDGTVKLTKPPFQAACPSKKAKSNDPSTWGTYEEALAAVSAGKANGIGFMLKDSEIAAVDLDHVRDSITGELVEWARLLLVEAQELGLYCEVTVSGTGLRFIGLVPNAASELHRKITFNRKNGAGIELYRNCARYITISGMQSASVTTWRRSAIFSTSWWSGSAELCRRNCSLGRRRRRRATSSISIRPVRRKPSITRI